MPEEFSLFTQLFPACLLSKGTPASAGLTVSTIVSFSCSWTITLSILLYFYSVTPALWFASRLLSRCCTVRSRFTTGTQTWHVSLSEPGLQTKHTLTHSINYWCLECTCWQLVLQLVFFAATVTHRSLPGRSGRTRSTYLPNKEHDGHTNGDNWLSAHTQVQSDGFLTNANLRLGISHVRSSH